MPYTSDLIDELEILSLFDLATTQHGIKVHSSADTMEIAATKRLYEKGMITQADGGYLTGLGHDAAVHAESLMLIMVPEIPVQQQRMSI